MLLSTLAVGLFSALLCHGLAVFSNSTGNDMTFGNDSAGLTASTTLGPVTWDRFRFFAIYDSETSSSGNFAPLWQSLQTHYAQASAQQSIDANDRVVSEEVEEVRSSLEARWSSTIPRPPSNGEVTAMLNELISVVGTQWRIVDKPASFVIHYNGQAVLHIKQSVNAGQLYSFAAVGYDWSGTMYPDRPFPEGTGSTIFQRLCTQIIERFCTHESSRGEVAQGSSLTFTQASIEVTLAIYSGRQDWPQMYWDDLEDALEFLDDQYQGLALYHDFWLEMGYRGSGQGHSTPIGTLQVKHQRDLRSDDLNHTAQEATASATKIEAVA